MESVYKLYQFQNIPAVSQNFDKNMELHKCSLLYMLALILLLYGSPRRWHQVDGSPPAEVIRSIYKVLYFYYEITNLAGCFEINKVYRLTPY